ncbi:MFS transporter [Thermopolyspora sp. NPDC052614]|uniref:MFS transporter n=1 Tax=Thermopolyspora sp. NPDC052614 TaxID=3155682 RepID=UPI00341B3724
MPMAVSPGAERARAAAINARLDGLPGFGLNMMGRIALMLTFLFANYDISVLTITLPALSTDLGLSGLDLSWPVAANLVAYGVGAYICGHIADRRGRRLGLGLTILILGIGGVLSAFSWDLVSFTVFRFITGCGMGAVLALATVYLGEFAPKGRRGRIISQIYLVQAILLIVIGFVSLPVLDLDGGWRILLGAGGLVLLVLPLLNDRALMESPRWLAEHARLDRAEKLTRAIETRMGVTPSAAEQAPPPEEVGEEATKVPLSALLRKPYAGRLAVSVIFWFAYYVAFYGLNSYMAIILEDLGVALSDAILITVITRLTGPIACILLITVIERVERRTIIILGCLAQGIGLAFLITDLGMGVFTAAMLLYTFAVGIVTPPAFTYTAEMFPTRARGTAAAIGDGVGHFGGAIAPFLILPILQSFGGTWTVIAVIACICVAAAAISAGVRTRNRALTEIAA